MHKCQAVAAKFLSDWFAADETFALLVRLPDEAADPAADSSRYRSDEVELSWLACL